MQKRTQNQRTDDQRVAREYIDRIAAINRRHGMGSSIPPETYDQAVKEAARHLRVKQR